MKKIVPFILLLTIIIACNNAAETKETKDSTNMDVNTNTTTDPGKDTSSYERMPNKINDSMRQ